MEKEVEAIEQPPKVKVERELEQLSRLTDTMFRVPVLGWRFGLDAILGFFFPVAGDTATALASFYILVSAVRYRVPKITLLRMGLNIALDYIVGALPVVGDLFDAWWKANKRNIELLRRRATVSPDQAGSGRTSDWLFVGLIILCLIALLIGPPAQSAWHSQAKTPAAHNGSSPTPRNHTSTAATPFSGASQKAWKRLTASHAATQSAASQ
jgi:hypothetical protein